MSALQACKNQDENAEAEHEVPDLQLCSQVTSFESEVNAG
jgi:hypothetical protein